MSENTAMELLLAEAHRQRSVTLLAMTPEDEARERRRDKAFRARERASSFWYDYDERDAP